MRIQDTSEIISLASNSEEIRTGTDSPQFWSGPTLARWAESELGVLLVCEISDSIVGFIIAAYNPISRDGYLHCLIVSPIFRRQGVGTALLREAETELLARGCNHIFGLIKPENYSSGILLKQRGFSKGQQFAYWEKSITPEA